MRAARSPLWGNPEVFWGTFHLVNWTDLLFRLGLGLYLFLGGGWIVSRIFLGLEEGRCPKCGYDMTGLDDGAVCPECGEQIAEPTK